VSGAVSDGGLILAVGLSPAWQQILCFHDFRPGEVNRARSAHWCASGKVLNVGLALHALGARARTLSLCGGGPAGAALRQDFERLGVDVRWVDTVSPMRVCTTILDESTGRTTELVENAPAITLDEVNALHMAYQMEIKRASLVVLTGSLPPGVGEEFFNEMLAGFGVPALLDVRGWSLTAALMFQPRLVKPNREELEQTVERSLPDEAAVFDAMHELHRAGAETVVVSQGAGPLLALDDEDRYRVQPPTVRGVNPIGCGDCLAAGLAVALDRGDDIAAVLRFGVAAAAVNAQELLPARLDAQAVAELASRVRVERL
jgi:1-phosphofructokinase family hexose kinase